MSRPLMQHGVELLEALFSRSKSDIKILNQLEYELEFRGVPRAVALLARVRAAIRDVSTDGPVDSPARPRASSPILQSQPSIGDSEPVGRVVTTRDTASVQSDRPTQLPTGTQGTPATVQGIMPLDEAYKVLKIAPGASWLSVEKSRRQLVQQSHPSRLRPLSAEKRAQTLEAARKVNAAYSTLVRANQS